MLRRYVRSTSSDECHHHHPHWRCTIVEKGVTSSSQHQQSQVPLDCSWRCGQPFKDRPSSIILHCHHTSHAGDAAGRTAGLLDAILQDSCRAAPVQAADSSHAATLLPSAGPRGGSWRLQMPPEATTHTTALYCYLLQWCPPAVSGGSNSFLSFTSSPSVILMILSSPVPSIIQPLKASSVR